MNTVCYAGILVFATLFSVSAEPLLPTLDGTTWDYEVRDEPPNPDGATNLSVRISGTERLHGKELLTFEKRAGGALTETELLNVDDEGIHRYRRTNADGKSIVSDPPQTLVPAPLQPGAKWELDDRTAGMEMHQQFTIVGQESVAVPAGVYAAYRLHSEQPWPLSINIDRWFVPGVGVVKDVTTSRGPNGRLLSRSTTVLKQVTQTPAQPPLPPEPTATPQPSAPSAAPRITLEVAAARDGEPQTDFRSDAPNIFVRWSGQRLPLHADVRVTWVADDVGDIVPHDFIIDDTETTITQPEFGARFTLSRPEDGWAEGKYRVDLYLDDVVVQSVSVTIHD